MLMKGKMSGKLLGSVSVGVFCVVAANVVFAQQDKDQLQEIVVTAQKRESTVQSTPISITALSGEMLQDLGYTNVLEIASLAPGISARSSGPGQTEFEMRGLASTAGSAPTVGFYLDEAA